MKRLLRPILSLVLLAGLAWFAFHEIQKDEREGKVADSALVFPVAARNVSEITVELAERKATFRRGASGWEKALGPDDADIEAVTDFIGAWSHVRLLQTVDESPRGEDLTRFGLSKPLLVVNAKLTPGTAGAAADRPASLVLGAPAPLQPSCYARLDGFPRVVLVSPDVLDMLNVSGRRLVGLPAIEPPEPRRGGQRGAPRQ